MKRVIWILSIFTMLALTACGQSTAPTAIPTVILGPASPSNNPSPGGSTVSASAELVPVDKVRLSFPLVGTVDEIQVEVGDLVQSGDALVQLDTVILEAKVAEAEANVASAETQVRYLKRVGPGDEQLQAAEAEVERALAGVEQAKAILEQATLKSPIKGTVVSVDIAQGETVVPGQVVVVIGDLSDLRVETTDLSEQDVPAVKVGQSASVFIDALGQEFDGKVVEIARTPESIGGDVVYKVTIELDQQPADVRWGMSADVEIQTE